MQKGPDGYQWVPVDGPRKPQERREPDQATTLPDEPETPVQPQKKRAGVATKKRGTIKRGKAPPRRTL
jgi:hypothetical protein